MLQLTSDKTIEVTQTELTHSFFSDLAEDLIDETTQLHQDNRLWSESEFI